MLYAASLLLPMIENICVVYIDATLVERGVLLFVLFIAFVSCS